ncbi:PepSY domain-containing protein [Mycolicibacterium sp. 018/SC-01/001]|uniref:PepSY-associated TM helix domain-containing protein n=1 Tax=Mycolicibacterium sp. 018/SC-01/001 TaxID=2592069 RepID=UPI00117C411C|nr:PepSY-associated TM helix domain-containing protein [Mycolicibacterium sp. 018/SC-01/001]TRW81399.1 PepSY domain-containing protein [Mycolicibacterium sp. 018/SC-01/001]
MTLSDDTVDPLSPDLSPPRRGWRPLLVRLHFYAGVLVAPFLIVAAVTGALYALAPSIERVVYRDVLSVDATAGALPLHGQVARARAVHPDLAVSSIRPAAAAGDTTRVAFADPALPQDHSRTVFVDPGTGRVLGEQVTWLGYLPVSTWLDGLHRHLHLGEPGRIYSELAASWLWVVALGGTALWVSKAVRDRRRGRRGRVLGVDRATTGRSRTLNWHGATGIWLLVGLLFLSATGITWSTYAGAHVTDIRAAFHWQRPQVDTASSDPHAGHHEMPGMATDSGSIDVAGVVDAAAAHGVAGPVEITMPAGAGQAVTVTEIDAPFRATTNAAAVNPADLSVPSVVNYWRDYSTMAKLADWGVRAHMGLLFGLLNQLLLLAVAVGLLTVIVRGYRMWWQRRPIRGSVWAVGRAPTRGGLRALHPAAIGVVVAVAVAVGWFLPLLGWSLAGFVAIDLVLGLRSRRATGDTGA